ncbi:MAG TPA: nicotinate phosphoribosyltransferase [Acidimicrobiia bacterium]|jgi:nicotinate phosphoribosyltransferase|nr:nicotinate phosphoribosyltransferase [Acidimicrobiia bacterium]
MTGVDDTNAALFVDLYELTMSASYHAHGLDQPATFDLFARQLPPGRGYLVSCGLDAALDYLERLQFDDTALDYLGSLDLFDESFLSMLSDLRFTGEVRAIPEGELVFPNEPIVQVTAPLVEAQLVETFLLNCIGYQTMIATKAARVATACGDRTFVDFSPRRDHGTDAALKTARAAYVGGAAATSLVLGGQVYGLELSGTMAHSYVMRFDNEADAFLTYARDFPGRAIFLIDTYDTEHAARTVVDLAGKLEPEGLLPRAVRLDSGDIDALSRSVRAILDDGGLTEVQIFASGDLDEYRIEDLMTAGAPIDAFGVGTQLGTSGDAPHVAVVYKLVEDASGPKVKLSEDKVTLPGRKQVFRNAGDGGELRGDVLALEDEQIGDARPMLQPVMRDGRRLATAEPLGTLRDRCRASLAALPPRLRALEPEPPPYEVRTSPDLDTLVRQLHEDLGAP